MQHTKFTGPIAERKRNALEAAWLGQLSRIPGATATKLDTSDDLYSYLLIDTRSGWELTTSVVAQVIASLQQYINNILLGSEPGYSKVRWQQEHPTLLENWRSTNAQYDVWAANVMLAQYPENYLSPPLRTGQTRDFAQMVSDLNQGPLNDDTILEAVQGYLNRFEDVANLSLVSGYVAGTDLTKDDYYFLGRTASKPHTHYWRKCAMRLNTVTTMVPDAWSEWLKVDLPLGSDNIIGLPRPVLHNKRLHVVWFERKATDSKPTDAKQTITPTTTLSAQMAYLKFDGTWSTPQILGSAEGNTVDAGDGLYARNAKYSTVALQFTDASQNPFLYAGLYSAADAKCPVRQMANEKAMVCALDAWMNPATPNSDAIEVLFALYADQKLAKDNQNASVANTQTTSQRFLQRAIATTPEVLLTDSTLMKNDAGVAGKMPVLQVAMGTAPQPNMVVIDTTNMASSRVWVDFRPGKMTVDCDRGCEGAGHIKFNTSATLAEANYYVLFNSGQLEASVEFKDQTAYDAVAKNCRLFLGFNTPGSEEFIEIETNNDDLDPDDKSFSTLANVGTDKRDFHPENLSAITFKPQGGEPIARALLPEDMSKRISSNTDYVLQLSITNGNTEVASVYIDNRALSAEDHCTATLTNLDLTQKSEYSFQFAARMAISSPAKSAGWKRYTTRRAFSTVRTPQSLTPATDPMPVLDSYTDTKLGTAEFVHFDFKANANKAAAFAPENIRLNTLFAKELVKSAQSGLDRLFQWNTQLTPEPNMGPGTWLALTLPAYDPAVHGERRARSVVMFPKDNLHYPLAAATLADSPKLIEVFIPSNDVLLLDEKDSQGVSYQIIRVYLQDAEVVFSDKADQVVLAFKKERVAIAPQVLNDVAWGRFKRYSDFTKAAAEPGATNAMDFSDANGLYFWELFFHTPAMVAYALQSRGQHADARTWQQRIFDPAAINQGTDSQGNTIGNYWKVVPVSPSYAKEDSSYAIEGPTNPDALAYADPQHFRKASYMDYLRTQLALGDLYYRQLTPDSLNQALQIYTQTSVLMGPRPDDGLVSPWQPISLKQAAGLMPHGELLADFEQQLMTLPESWSSYPTETDYSSLKTAPSTAFRPPVNNHLLALWDILDSRRFNLRHSLDINGAPLHLPLFATPLDPTALLTRAAQGGTTVNQSGAGLASIVPYRYGTMSDKAREACSLLSQFGQQLLRALEAKDDRQREILGQTQLADLWTFTRQAQQQAVDIAENSLATLHTSLAAAQQRAGYYQGLVDGGRSPLESDTLATLATAGILMGSVGAISIAAGAVALAPNIFGLAAGGSNWAGPLKGVADGTMALAQATTTAAQAIGMHAGFERRQAEWQQQTTQANADVATLNSQIVGQQLQIAAAKTAKALATAQHQQVMATYAFLSNRFTNEALYQWLIAQLSALYYQAYDATLSLCLSAQTCWQYELGDFTSTFIPYGGWNSQYQGLLAGETLRLSLQQMDNAWLMRNTRSLNITRSISLREKLGEKAWEQFLATLKAGKATFSLTEQDFDLDYPGHYLRQIASLSVSLPALIGPYQNVRATVTQTGNSLIVKPDLEAVKFLKDNKTGSAANVKRNLNASQEIALSAGLDDSGTFVLDSNDGRYLPFEGTGAVSDWILAFPNPASAAQQTVLSSLTDVVVTVRYNARNGGEAFADQVLKFWKAAD